MAKIYENLTALIGNTPLVELKQIEKVEQLQARLIAKVEYFNPGGSVKDRIDHAFGSKVADVVFNGLSCFALCSDGTTVLENVMFPLDMFSDDTLRGRTDRAMACLDRVGLADAAAKYPGEISGGMQKRVAIARAVAPSPRYLFCDEPNSGLDPKTSLVIDELIHSITAEYGITTIVNTHDMNSVVSIGDHILFLHQGQPEWQGTKDQVLDSKNENLSSFIFASDLFRQMAEDMRQKRK